MLIVSFYFLVGFTAFSTLAIMIWEVLAEAWVAGLFFRFLGLPLLVLAVAGHMACLVMNFAVPAKAEGRGAIIAGLVFFGLLIFVVILIIVTFFDGIMADPERKQRMMELLSYGAMLCFVLGLVSTAAYLAKFMIFMRLHLESSKPITSAGFVILTFAILAFLTVISPKVKEFIGDWMCFVVALAAGIVGGVAIRILISYALLLAKIRKMISNYIREA